MGHPSAPAALSASGSSVHIPTTFQSWVSLEAVVRFRVLIMTNDGSSVPQSRGQRLAELTDEVLALRPDITPKPHGIQGKRPGCS